MGEAEIQAVKNLGDPSVAGRRFKRIYLTADEANTLKNDLDAIKIEIHSSSKFWKQWLFLGAAMVVFLIMFFRFYQIGMIILLVCVYVSVRQIWLWRIRRNKTNRMRLKKIALWYLMAVRSLAVLTGIAIFFTCKPEELTNPHIMFFFVLLLFFQSLKIRQWIHIIRKLDRNAFFPDDFDPPRTSGA